MRSTTPRRLFRGLAAALLATAALIAPSLATAATTPQVLPGPVLPTAGYAGPCTDDLGVTVVVDFQALGSYGGHSGSTVVRCAPGSNGQPFQGSGLAAFQAAGISIAGTSNYGLAFVCRVNGRPMADEPLAIPGNDAYTEQCNATPPPSAFWSYWQADNGGSWAFSQLGVKDSTARAGGFEALSFSLNTTHIPPRTAPNRPSPEPPPTQEPSPSPTPSPAPSPSPSPTPNPSPSPAPGNPAPGSPAPTAPGSPAPPSASGGSGGSSPSNPGPSAPGQTDADNTTEQAAPGDEAPGDDPASDPTDDSAAGVDLGELAAGQADAGDANGTASPDDDVQTDGSVSDDAQTTAPVYAQDESDGEEDAGQEAPTPSGQGGNPNALWVTMGTVLVLGGVAALASRRRREPDLTHHLDP